MRADEEAAAAAEEEEEEEEEGEVYLRRRSSIASSSSEGNDESEDLEAEGCRDRGVGVGNSADADDADEVRRVGVGDFQLDERSCVGGESERLPLERLVVGVGWKGGGVERPEVDEELVGTLS